jgi:hypothetical protein
LGDRGVTASHTVTVIGWIVLASTLVVLSLVAWVARGRVPSAIAVVRSASRSIVVRSVLLLGWAWVGWHLFVRTSR